MRRAFEASTLARAFVAERAVPETPGAGLELAADGVTWRLGRADWAVDRRRRARPTSCSRATARERRALSTAEVIRPDAKDEIAKLSRSGLDVWMLSGDEASRVRDHGRLASASTTDHAVGGASPDDKAALDRRPRPPRHLDDRRRDQRRPRGRARLLLGHARGRPALHARAHRRLVRHRRACARCASRCAPRGPSRRSTAATSRSPRSTTRGRSPSPSPGTCPRSSARWSCRSRRCRSSSRRSRLSRPEERRCGDRDPAQPSSGCCSWRARCCCSATERARPRRASTPTASRCCPSRTTRPGSPRSGAAPRGRR